MKDFFMAVLSSVAIEAQSVRIWLWYSYYRARYSVPGVRMTTLPAPLTRLLPYAKLVVAIAAIVAGVVVQVVAGPPAWALLIVAIAGAAGVYGAKNSQVPAEIATVIKDIENPKVP